MNKQLVMSTLPKTWLFDLDGTILKHNGYKLDREDTLLPGAKEFIDALPAEDRIIILTSRQEEFREQTVEFLQRHLIRYDEILFNLPMGERIVVNDRKPSGLDMSVAINLDRDIFGMPVVSRKK